MFDLCLHSQQFEIILSHLIIAHFVRAKTSAMAGVSTILIAMTESSTKIEQDKNRESADAESEIQRSRQENDSASPHKSRAIASMVILGLGTIVFGVVGYRWWRYHSTHSYTNDAYVTNYIHPVNPRITGTVLGVLVTDNRTVIKGQPLVKLDPRDYRVALQQQEANLAAAKANVPEAEAQLASTEADLQKTQADFKRYQ